MLMCRCVCINYNKLHYDLLTIAHVADRGLLERSLLVFRRHHIKARRIQGARLVTVSLTA